jgi:hypothetical protein
MTSFAQGQPFSSGPVWDQMRFGSEQTTGTMPIAGSLADPLAAIFSTPLPSGLSKDSEAFLRFGQLQRFNAAETAKQNKEMMQQYLTYQQQASERADAMGVKNQIIGSFLKDVPAAIGGFARAPLKFADQRIQMADNFAARGPSASAAPRNYYGFVG